MTDDPIVVTRNDLLTEWRRTHPGECSCPPRKVDPSCPQHGTGRNPMTILPEAITAMTRAVAAYEPEATAAVITSPGQLLSVLLEGSRRALEAAAPHIAAAERERIRQLATRHNAQYVPDCPDPSCPGPTAHMADETAPFAGLLTEGDTT